MSGGGKRKFGAAKKTSFSNLPRQPRKGGIGKINVGLVFSVNDRSRPPLPSSSLCLTTTRAKKEEDFSHTARSLSPQPPSSSSAAVEKSQQQEMTGALLAV